MPTQYDIFISHSSKDKALAEKLVDVLLTNGCDVSANRILCTSLEGLGIPAGTPSFIEFLREKIQRPKLVILLLTENYFASTFCVCELGAAWGMGLNTFPLVVPPLDKGKLKGTLKVTQAGDILDASYLDELRDAVNEHLYTNVKTARWNLKRDEFLKVAPSIISTLEKPSTVDRTELVAAEANYQAALDEVASKDEENDTLKAQIEELRKCKDATQVNAVVSKFSNDEQQFNALCERAEERLRKVQYATQTALYWHMRSGTYCPESNEWENVREAADIQEVIDPEDNTCYVNKSHPRVSKALEALGELSNFISEKEVDESSFAADFAAENEFPLSLSNKEFWSQYLVSV